jgi:pyruvate/2-oxoacid:ferredoxin oxidoreductase beta subunit
LSKKRTQAQLKVDKAGGNAGQSFIDALNNCNREYLIAEKTLEIYELSRKGERGLAAKVQKEVDGLMGQTVLPLSATTCATGVSQHKADEKELLKRGSTKL